MAPLPLGCGTTGLLHWGAYRGRPMGPSPQLQTWAPKAIMLTHGRPSCRPRTRSPSAWKKGMNFPTPPVWTQMPP